jgi:hypothetical protein
MRKPARAARVSTVPAALPVANWGARAITDECPGYIPALPGLSLCPGIGHAKHGRFPGKAGLDARIRVGRWQECPCIAPLVQEGEGGAMAVSAG